MDGMLSQDEINALLSSMEAASADEDVTTISTADVSEPEDNVTLSDVEKDAIGEVANISMGSSATTMYSLVNRKVNITTPIVTLARWENLLAEYEKPCVFIQIKYTEGLDGSNILVLKEHDVKVITDLMMGGDGTNTEEELGELHLSAISEAMNQMMGASATSLSTMLNKLIDISPPDSSLLDLSKFESGASIAPFLAHTFVKIAFRMQIDDLVDSTIMQLYPIDFAKDIVDTFISTQLGGLETIPEPVPEPEPTPAPMPQEQVPPMGDMSGMGMPQMDMGMAQMNMGMPQMNMGMPMMNMGMPMMNNMGMPMMNMGMPPMQNVAVQPAQFQNFSPDYQPMNGQENIGLIRDVPLEVTVELGRTSKSIADILEFAPGTIIELDKIAGEPIDVLVNGKFVAKGEVVVIEESFGVRVTEIIKE